IVDEKALFREFLEQDIEQYDDDCEFIAVRKVRDMLHPSGGYADIDFLLNYAADEPSVHLEMVENGLLSALEGLRAVRGAFELKLARSHATKEHPGSCPDASSEEEATLTEFLSGAVVFLTPDVRRMIAARSVRRSEAAILNYV